MFPRASVKHVLGQIRQASGGTRQAGVRFVILRVMRATLVRQLICDSPERESRNLCRTVRPDPVDARARAPIGPGLSH
jgi:hypothetical protein